MIVHKSLFHGQCVLCNDIRCIYFHMICPRLLLMKILITRYTNSLRMMIIREHWVNKPTATQMTACLHWSRCWSPPLFTFLGSTWCIGSGRKTGVLSHSMMQTLSADYLGMFSYLPTFLAHDYWLWSSVFSLALGIASRANKHYNEEIITLEDVNMTVNIRHMSPIKINLEMFVL